MEPGLKVYCIASPARQMESAPRTAWRWITRVNCWEQPVSVVLTMAEPYSSFLLVRTTLGLFVFCMHFAPVRIARTVRPRWELLLTATATSTGPLMQGELCFAGPGTWAVASFTNSLAAKLGL